VGEACHAIDTCVAIAGSPPVKVYAESVAKSGGLETSDDRVFITLRHADGSISSISYQTGGDTAFPAERIEVWEAGGLLLSTRGRMWNSGAMESWNVRRRKRTRVIQGEFATFLSACRSGGPAPIPWDQLFGVTWASLMAVRSLREGSPFALGASEEEA